ncbi:TSUP family transporter [Leptothrix discophora]|uniref:Probable membrane transporter protein n=1 Tax=Leptothrix discophora TaxID=89 RepID=A0ABT9G7G2_LEPDI|nr:TSUP family transporter [Leptothrix discophora]MDP4302442.1 TSUP family transporter [Leptothrix discophora]
MSELAVLPLFAGGLWPADLAASTYLGMGLMVLAGACLQGIGGLGFAMFSAPLAALFFPTLVPGPLLLLGCPLALLTLLREWQAVDLPAAGAALVGRLGGTALAAGALALLPATVLTPLFALLILLGVALSLGGWRMVASPCRTALAGVASGLMGTITSAGAPPFAIALQNLPAATLRATLGCVFFVGAAISLAALGLIGRLDGHHLLLGLLLLPWMGAGFALSGPLARRLPPRSLRPLLLGLAALGALTLLVQSGWQASSA